MLKREKAAPAPDAVAFMRNTLVLTLFVEALPLLELVKLLYNIVGVVLNSTGKRRVP